MANQKFLTEAEYLKLLNCLYLAIGEFREGLAELEKVADRLRELFRDKLNKPEPKK